MIVSEQIRMWLDVWDGDYDDYNNFGDPYHASYLADKHHSRVLVCNCCPRSRTDVLFISFIKCG